jgi:hypothetical protein
MMMVMMKYTNVMCTSFTKLILFMLRVSSTNTLSPSFHELLHATHVKFLAKVSELLMHTVVQLIFICKVASSDCILWGVGSWRVLNWDCREDDREQSTQLLQLFSLSADWCAVWCCHEGGGLDSSSSFDEPFEFIVLISLCLHVLLWIDCGTTF